MFFECTVHCRLNRIAYLLLVCVLKNSLKISYLNNAVLQFKKSCYFDIFVTTAAEFLVKGQSMEEALELQDQLLQEAARLKAQEVKSPSCLHNIYLQ